MFAIAKAVARDRLLGPCQYSNFGFAHAVFMYDLPIYAVFEIGSIYFSI